MKVLHIFNELCHSGAEVMFAKAAGKLAEAGIEGHILATGLTEGPYANAMRQAGYVVHHLPFARRWSYATRVLRLFRQVKPDVVHIQAERGYLEHAFLAWWAGVPAVRTFHNSYPFHGLLAARKRLERWGARWLFRVFTVAISESVRTTERGFGNPCVLFPNWVDTDSMRFPRDEERTQAARQLELPHGRLCIVSIGSCQPVKRHARVLEALAQLPSATRPLYLHVGQGSLEDNEKALAQRLGLAGDVRFLGVLDDVRPALWAADLFVMPSAYEGLSIAALEAAATGLPMALSDIASFAMFSGQEGVTLVRASSADAWAQAISEALSRPPCRHVSLRQFVVEGFGMVAGVGRYVEAYKSLARRGHVNPKVEAV